MRILHLTPYYAPAYAFGGVVRSVEGMARALVRRGHSVTVLTTDALDQHRRWHGPAGEMVDGVQIIRVRNVSPWLRGKLNLSTPPGLVAAAREVLPQIDVLHCHEFRTVENLLATPHAAAANLPLILSPHGTLTQSTGRSLFKQGWDALFSRSLARHFKMIIGLTGQEAAEARALWQSFGAWLPSERFAVVPNGVDPEQYSNPPGREMFRTKYGLGDGPVCLFMSRLHPRKGPHLLAEAFQRLDLPDARLVIAGPEEGAGPLIAPFVNDRVVLTGYLSGAERLAALAAADVLALPAVGEGLPMIVLEAMAAGLPLLISPGCNLPEAPRSGAGLEVEPQPELLTEALKTLLEDTPRRARMGDAARQLVKTRFTWDSVAEKLEALYTGICR